MKQLINTIVILGILLLVGCGTTNTTKTTFYNADGTINRIVEETAENSDFSKLVLCADMLAGRLEIFPILILLSRKSWRRR
jgi:Trk-type K+ transport system membrane component